MYGTEGERGIHEDLKMVLKETATYKRRYWMLFLFCIANFMSGVLYVCPISNADITSCYYGVSPESVNWTAMSYMVVYLMFFLPSDWMTERIGLRKTVLLGSFLEALCSVIQFGAMETDGFPVLMVSSVAGAFALLLLLAVPPLLAAVWFPENQVSRASAAGALSNQLGAALGFMFPPLVESSDCSNKPLIREGKETVAYTLTAVTVLFFLLTLFTFQNNPKIPPSIAELRKEENVKISYKESIVKILKNYYFLLLLFTNGCIMGVYFTIGTIINNLMLAKFPNEEVAIGWMGSLFFATCLISCFVAGYILDTYHKFREISIGLCISSCLSCVLLAGLMEIKKLWVQYITISMLGLFVTGFYSVAYEYGVEIIYPESETLSTGLLNCAAMICSIIFVPLTTYMIQKHGTLATNMLLAAFLLLSCISSYQIKSELKRTSGNLQ